MVKRRERDKASYIYRYQEISLVGYEYVPYYHSSLGLVPIPTSWYDNNYMSFAGVVHVSRDDITLQRTNCPS